MIFAKANNTTSQGDIGESRAIYELIKLGYLVSKPINDKAKYDLVVEIDNSLFKVQVKTTSKKAKRVEGGFEVKLSTTYANRSNCNSRCRITDDYDYLFVLSADDRVWFIPSINLGDAKFSIVVGNKKYSQFEL